MQNKVEYGFVYDKNLVENFIECKTSVGRLPLPFSILNLILKLKTDEYEFCNN
jgi:hypothetical protein